MTADHGRTVPEPEPEPGDLGALGELAGLDFAEVSPDAFARIVKSASAKEIVAVMRGPERRRILDEVFGRMETRFRPETAGTLRALVRWNVTGGPDGAPDVYETDIADGACAVRRGATDGRKPKLVLTLGEAEFLRLVSGNASGPVLFMTRKLRIEGDLGLAAGLTRYFDIPRA